jgi:hypothetical protein
MPNKPPVAILSASTKEITLPANRVQLDSSQSYDPNRRGSISHREYYQAAGTGTASFVNIDDRAGTCDVVFPSIRGLYTVGVKVWDNRGLLNEIPAELAITVRKPAFITNFGASGPTIDSPDNLSNMCGSPSCYRVALFLSQGDTYSKGADKYLSLGHTVFINVNEKPVSKDSAGNKIPNPFPTDMTKYRNQLIKVFDAYKNHPQIDKIIFTCENEPTTDVFHVGPMADYLTMLNEFISLCEDYGYRGIDGGVHVVTVLGMNSNQGEGNAAEVQELLAGYAKIPGMYAVNIHGSNRQSDGYNSADTVNAVTKIYNITGHNTVCGEWHVQKTTNTKVLTDMCQGWFDAKVEFSVYITTGTDVILNNGNTLTNFGKAYQDFINSHK